MKIISSQRYIDNVILNEKIAFLESQSLSFIILYVWATGIDNTFILFDGHHRLEAATQLGICVEYQEASHPENLSGIDLLEQSWIDSDWYEIDSGKPAF